MSGRTRPEDLHLQTLRPHGDSGCLEMIAGAPCSTGPAHDLCAMLSPRRGRSQILHPWPPGPPSRVHASVYSLIQSKLCRRRSTTPAVVTAGWRAHADACCLARSKLCRHSNSMPTVVKACWRKRCTSGLLALEEADEEGSPAAEEPGAACSGSPSAPRSISGCRPHMGSCDLQQPGNQITSLTTTDTGKHLVGVE